jgi:hypothetical protein
MKKENSFEKFSKCAAKCLMFCMAGFAFVSCSRTGSTAGTGTPATTKGLAKSTVDKDFCVWYNFLIIRYATNL